MKNLYNEWKNDKFYETIVIGVIGVVGIEIIVSIVYFIRKTVNKAKESNIN